MPPIRKKVGIARCILPHAQGVVGARLKPLFQADGMGSGLFQTEPWIREGSYGQSYSNNTTATATRTNLNPQLVQN